MTEKKACVLIVDSPSDRRSVTARAHALSLEVDTIYLTRGLKYPGSLISQNCPGVKVKILDIAYNDARGVLKAAQELQPDLIEVGQEDAIEAKIPTILKNHRFLVFGCGEEGIYEADKAYARRKMKEAGAGRVLPEFEEFRDKKQGLSYIRNKFIGDGYKGTLYLKATNQCLGKGVFGVESVEEAEYALFQLDHLPNQAGRVFSRRRSWLSSKRRVFQLLYRERVCPSSTRPR